MGEDDHCYNCTVEMVDLCDGEPLSGAERGAVFCCQQSPRQAKVGNAGSCREAGYQKSLFLCWREVGIASPRLVLNKLEVMAVRTSREACPQRGKPEAHEGTIEKEHGYDSPQPRSQWKEGCKCVDVVVCVSVCDDMDWADDVCGSWLEY